MRRMMVLTVVVIGLISGGCGASKGTSTSAPQGAPAGQGQTQTAQTPAEKTHFAKTKFALHAGLAFGAFHRYIYKPLKAGSFAGGPLKNKKAALKGALAALFAYHEVKVALKDARSSPILSKALSPLLSLQTKLASLKTGLKRGNVDQTTIESANTDASQVSTAGSKAGQLVMDEPTPQLGG